MNASRRIDARDCGDGVHNLTADRSRDGVATVDRRR
jgi:hypothetical protein